MNIELEEVVGLDVSDDALELAAGDAQGGVTWAGDDDWFPCRIAIADR